MLNRLFYVFVLVFSLCSIDAIASDMNMQKRLWPNRHLVAIAAIDEAVKAGQEVNLIVGRRAFGDEHSHAPLSTDANVIWVYADIGYDLTDRFKLFGNQLQLWIDFNVAEQVNALPDASFTKVWIDWSVIKFFDDMEMLITNFHRVLKPGGQFVLLAGEQQGMRTPCNVYAAISKRPCTFELDVLDEKFPTCVTLCACEDKSARAQKEIIERQQAYLEEIFGANNVELKTGLYPPAPDNIDGARPYFLVTKTL